MEAIHLKDEMYLIRGLHRGGQAAFDVLFQMFHPALCFFARRLTIDLPKGQAECVHPDGKLGYVQNIGDKPVGAAYESTNVYGVGAFLLAGSEYLKFLE